MTGMSWKNTKVRSSNSLGTHIIRDSAVNCKICRDWETITNHGHRKQLVSVLFSTKNRTDTNYPRSTRLARKGLRST